MSTETKRREVLQMLANGSITAEEASELLLEIRAQESENAAPEAPDISEPSISAPEVPAKASGKKARWLNVRVTDTDSGRDRVSVRIPLSLARVGLRMGAKFSPEIDNFDWDEMLQELSSSAEQSIVEVNDQDDGELVRIFLS